MKYTPYITTAALAVILLPAVALADENITLFQKNIPFLGSATDLSIENYVNALYQVAISLAAVLAVIKLILAGVKYMFSEVVTNKEEAKKDIRGALFGLLIVLGAVTILNTINPSLTELDFLERAPTQVFCGPDTPPGVDCRQIYTPAKTTTVSTPTNTATGAQSVADKCGGSIRRNNNPDGTYTWVAVCTNNGGGNQTNTRTQLSGWPQTFPFTNPTAASDAATVCQNSGGVVEQEQAGTPPTYIVNCYQK